MRAMVLKSVAAALLILPGTLFAQMSGGGSSGKPISFGAMGGIAIPSGDGSEDTKTGFNLTGSAYLQPASSGALSFRGDVGYDRFTAEETSDVSVSFLSFTANARYVLGSSSAEGGIRPYLIGGGGLYRGKLSINISGTSVSETETDFGISGGLGLEFQLSGFTTFAEGRFVNVFGEGDSSARWIPITFGIRF